MEIGKMTKEEKTKAEETKNNINNMVSRKATQNDKNLVIQKKDMIEDHQQIKKKWTQKFYWALLVILKMVGDREIGQFEFQPAVI